MYHTIYKQTRILMKRLSLLTLAASLCLPIFCQTSPKEPLYVLLYARITDHVNADITEDRLRRLLPLIESYRNKYPTAHMSAAILFSGASSRALAERNSQTHIVDFVKQYIQKGVVEVGYDGTDEPTYATRPTVDFSGSDPESRWKVRWAEEEKFLTLGRDPLTGEYKPGTVGGLKEMQEVFGKAAWVTGVMPLQRTGTGGLPAATTRARAVVVPPPVTTPILMGLVPEMGGETEADILVHRYAPKAVMFGVLNDNPAKVPGFRAGRAGFSALMSPVPETPPELYWQDNVLRSSETANDDVRLLHGSDGAEALQKLTAKADRSRIHVIHIELASEMDYLRPEFVKSPEFPALKYAYDHPQSPALPADARRSQDDVNAAYAKQEALLNWLTSQFIPSEPGSRIVTSADLTHMAARAMDFPYRLPDYKSRSTNI